MNEDMFMSKIPEEEFLEGEIENRGKRGCLIKTVALLILLAFIAFSFPNFSYLFFDKLSFLDQNKELSEDQIVKKVRPAVVNIEVVDTNQPFATLRHGTGFNTSPTGTIITNQHVVANAGTVTVTFGDGSKYYSKECEVIPGVDLAVIKLAGKELPSIPLAAKNQAQRGDIVTIIGNPLGFEKVSQRGEVGDYHKIEGSLSPVFDIKLPVNPGSSGSPVINGQAQVVGIVFASTSVDINGKSETRALAIPVQELPPSVIPKQSATK
ncbi:MAG: serine protease [Syntrophomonas sp.]